MSFKLLSMGLLGGAPSTPKLSKAAKPSARTETIHNELAQIRARDNFPLITIFALIQFFGQIAAYSTALSTPHSETRDWNRIFSKFTFFYMKWHHTGPPVTPVVKSRLQSWFVARVTFILFRGQEFNITVCVVLFLPGIIKKSTLPYTVKKLNLFSKKVK